MGKIYINYNGKTGFSRSTDKTGLAGALVSYVDFKRLSADIETNSKESYGITIDPADVQDFIANYEVDSFFTASEKE
ncbi:MAG: hypothetical protein M0P01_12700 [Treponema sp.]|nr:hypothetical protein [Treponema sp.]